MMVVVTLVSDQDSDQMSEAIRWAFDDTKGGGWQWATYEQLAPNGDVIGVMTMLCCPLCGAAVVMPSDEEIEKRPEIDWPTKHVEHHVRLGY